MAHTNWAVEYPFDRPRLRSLSESRPFWRNALRDARVDEWAYEVDGEPEEDYQEFKRRLDEAASIGQRCREVAAFRGGEAARLSRVHAATAATG
ncbi:hypothetical protein [Streptomyces sp. NPDC001222]|uniref:hypothetical protein n=1 Tax=Streptomyces sp. NPDC001222 TaxID=3364548 RepID=UPI0036B161DD